MKTTNQIFDIDAEVYDWAKALAKELNVSIEDLFYIALKCSIFKTIRIKNKPQVPVKVPVTNPMMKKLNKNWKNDGISPSTFFRTMFVNYKDEIVNYVEETNKYFNQ